MDMDDNYIFVIAGGKSAILHPFDTQSGLFRNLDAANLKGRLGLTSDSAVVQGLREKLYVQADSALRKHLTASGYYVRLAISAGLFLAVFMLFSIVIRDPVPFIDEFLLASLAALAFFLVSERRILSSDRFHGLATQTRQLIDMAFFNESRIVSIIETWREEIIMLGPAAFYKANAEGDQYELMDDDIKEAEALCAACARRWRKQGLVSALYTALQNTEPTGRVLDKIIKKMGIDEAALVMAYMKLLQALARRKVAL
jgi:hypothetical protein